MILGCNVHVDWAEQSDPAVRADIRQKLLAMGVTSVRMDYAWTSVQPNGPDQWDWAELDKYINEFAGDGFMVLPMLYQVPAWASASGSSGKNAVPRNPADFGRFAGEVGKRYGSKLAGVELHNEPDLDVFWSGTRQQFAELLAGAYPVAKAIAPNTLFGAAAATYLGLASGWYADMYATGLYGAGKTHDWQGIHPYPSPSDLPPNAPASDWSLNGIPDLQQLRSANGDTSPLWVTEVGYSTHDSPDDAENWKRGISQEEQAAYTVGTYIVLDTYEVEACYFYTDRDMAQTSEPHERNFGFLTTNNDEKLVATVMTAIHESGPPEPPDPDNGGGSDTEARIAALEAQVAALVAQDAELAANLQAAADDLA